jgi:rhodanese-related sulfurtransferase
LPAEWPFPNFIKRTLEKFPDAGVCTVDEARVLNHEGGYDFLDVRTETEHEYRIAYSVNVPIITGQWRFNTEAKCKLPQQAVNADFVAQVSTVFAKDAKIIVVCSDGRVRCLGALQALDEAGFTNLVGMRGGYNGFSRVFDSKFARRVDPDAMKEVESRDFPDQSTGIFGTGAGYDRVDTVAWVPVGDPIKWLSYQEEMAKLAK